MSQIDALRQAVQLSPDNLPLLILFAHANFEELQIDEARRVYESVLEKDPSHREARMGQVRCLAQEGKLSEAVLRLESLLMAAAADAPAHQLMSRLLAQEGNFASAREHYTQAGKLPGFSPDAALEKQLFFEQGESSPRDKEKVRLTASSRGWEAEFDDDDEDDEDDDDDREKPAGMERPAINFKDIGGMESVKEEIRMKILHPMQNPDLFRAYGKKIGGGVLLYGPPGCGKTLISRATAGEIDANFLSIGLHEILDLYIGESEKNLHRLFELARDNAPSVLFFDEVDALAADRTDLRKSAGRTLINQFLAEMDGDVASNDGLLILGATNAPWHIDPAFRRPGRFDRILFVPPPDEPARAGIIEVMANGRPVAGLDAVALAKKCKDFSGADIKGVFDLAIEKALSEALKKGGVVPITTRDLTDAAKRVKPSTKAWFESAKNYALYSNQGGFYDEVLEFLGIKK